MEQLVVVVVVVVVVVAVVVAIVVYLDQARLDSCCVLNGEAKKRRPRGSPEL